MGTIIKTIYINHEMAMTRFHVVAIASGLLVPISGPGFSAHQSRHPSRTQSQGAVKKNRGLESLPYDSSRVPAFDYRSGTSDYPFGPGINFPYPGRPYGDPDRWGEN
jgi:hypothetical protein